MTSETLALNFAARSDRGLVRSNNEDSAVAASNLLALADGMGGHAAGEVASQLMIEALLPLNAEFLGDGARDITVDRLPGMLVEAMDNGNRAIAAHVDENPTLDGMGCTLSALLFFDGRMGVCHVGDSRGYLLRDDVLTQITKDDTYVQSLVDEGKLDPADVSSHPQRSLILKALTGRPVEPTLQLLEVHAGDRFMLCSDGLSDPVSADTIREVLATGTPDEAAAKLIDLALRGGGPDNVTVVVADVVDTAAPTDDGTPLVLPTVATLAGAINSDETELPRPDTAAGRAMAVNVVNSSSPVRSSDQGKDAVPAASGTDPNAMPPMRRSRRVGRRRDAGSPGASTGDQADPDRAGDTGAGRRDPKRRRRILIALTVVVALVVVAGIGGWIAKRNLDDSYFVAVASSDDVPAPTTTSAAAPTTAAAPTSAAPATTQPPAPATSAPATTGAASPSTTLDMDGTADPEAAAAAKGTPILIYQGAPGSFLGISLNSAYQEICLSEDAEIRLLPAGSDDSCHRFTTADLTPAARGTLDTLPRDSYQSVQDQLRRLAAQTLPICVTRGSDRDSDGDPSDLTTPGVSCREVD
ncbi:PP2C family protein-serine/threonine phosphatase [Corynebacterium variabile]|uniref:PP2C family protein-serine/threonine phosphatase n=1 Tax=Corynebacterium variabile TaxID=1727 RepID=UPI0026498B0B|nr:protein phosphatase 2C domain-containing protein [Corynebacterium variabile]MDN6478514.1 protein phosphatase 2C domain-containing protein [Corynebacterium variabile]